MPQRKRSLGIVPEFVLLSVAFKKSSPRRLSTKGTRRAAFGKIGDGYVKAIHQYAEEHKIPIVHFEKGQNKEKMAQPYLQAAAQEGKDRVVLIGIAQEKASVWRSWPQRGQENKAHPHMDWDREPAYINHFYFYLWDSEWGGCFLYNGPQWTRNATISAKSCGA